MLTEERAKCPFGVADSTLCKEILFDYERGHRLFIAKGGWIYFIISQKQKDIPLDCWTINDLDHPATLICTLLKKSLKTCQTLELH